MCRWWRIEGRAAGLSEADFCADTSVGVNFEKERVGEAPVDDVRLFDAAIEGDHAGFDLGEHAFADFFFDDELLDLGFGDGAEERGGVVFFGADAVGIRDKDEFFGMGGGGDEAGGGVGVDVEFVAGGVAGDGGDDGDEVGLGERHEELGIDSRDLAHVPDVDLAAVLSGEEHFFSKEGGGGEGVQGHGFAALRVDGVDDEFVDVIAEDVFGNGEGAFIGVAAPLDELGLEAGFFHGVGDGFAAAVNDDGAHADSLHEDNVGEDFAELFIGVHEGASDLDDDDFFIEALDVGEGFNEGVGFVDNGGVKGGIHGGSGARARKRWKNGCGETKGVRIRMDARGCQVRDGGG